MLYYDCYLATDVSHILIAQLFKCLDGLIDNFSPLEYYLCNNKYFLISYYGTKPIYFYRNLYVFQINPWQPNLLWHIGLTSIPWR